MIGKANMFMVVHRLCPGFTCCFFFVCVLKWNRIGVALSGLFTSSYMCLIGRGIETCSMILSLG